MCVLCVCGDMIVRVYVCGDIVVRACMCYLHSVYFNVQTSHINTSLNLYLTYTQYVLVCVLTYKNYFSFYFFLNASRVINTYARIN